MKNLLTEGGAGGHMAHPFDLDYVKTGADLLSFFKDRVPEYLKDHDPHIKTDGVNISFKLIKKANALGEEAREFAADRGSQKPVDLAGITATNIDQRFAPGHGMIPAITEVLDILNAALETGTIDEELKILGLWDNPDYFINTEYVKETEERPIMNAVKYGEDFLAFHGVKEFFMTPSPKGKSMSRANKEIGGSKNSNEALMSLARKVSKFSGGYNIYGPGDAKASLREGTVINFDRVLGEKIPVFLSEGSEKVDTLGGWLRNAKTRNPKWTGDGSGAKIVLADGKKIDALSKHVYFNLILNKVPVSELLGTQSEDNVQMAIDAINGGIFYHATRVLGRTVLQNLYASLGQSTADKHEGIVMRNKEIFGVPFPIKLTGDFIYTGATGAVSQQMNLDKEAAQIEPTVERKIAVFPGAFKPPHRGHMNVVEALLQNGVDQVVVLISKLDRKTPAGKPVDRAVSERIWQIYIDSKGVGDRVSIGDSPYNTPVKAAYEVLKGNVPDLVPQPGDMIIPAASDKPGKGGNPDYTRFLKFHEGIEGMIDGVIPANIMEWYYEAPPEAPMSASAFRAALDTGKGLEAFLPTNVDPKQVLDVLGVEAEEEEPIEEISSMSGGDVEGAPSGGQFPGLDVEKENRRQKEISGIQRESKLVNQVLDYLLERLEFRQ
mgnify:CR=1 FL=1|tara:strand:+ start:1886 stop:3877 length:1992 start_codon:yes stop_codon:yes gene_type:complete